MSEPVNALAKQFASDAGLTRPCCALHTRVEPCPLCAASGDAPRLPDAATRERQDAQRYRRLKAHLACVTTPTPQASRATLWQVALPHACTFDAAVDLLAPPCPRCGVGWRCFCTTPCDHPLGDIDPQTGHVVCVACGVDVEEEP